MYIVTGSNSFTVNYAMMKKWLEGSVLYCSAMCM